LKRGQGKYKGKLQFKCFNYGGVEHFVVKCPYKGKDDDEYHEHKEKGENQKRSKKFRRTKRINYYIFKENNCSSKDSENETFDVLFMDIEDKKKKPKDIEESKDDELDVEVNLEGELIVALEELDIERGKNKRLSKKS